ncbi:DUF2812 domain-containing protein [Anaerovorax sp. IOR16]|uniref:DUF2812 domain-containing protein n=1 Tax=Anaerovorax sp. IOR16 TaxID=2773458 RepID=UPI0019D1E077|nr:DUF2812 domain-containing protein [Anaerovorax sp. IOR16]
MTGLDTKYQLWLFSFFDYKGVKDHLNTMYARGWEIQSIGTWLWKYKKIKPANKKFSVCFYNDGLEWSKQGWQKILEWKKMQIFSTEEDKAIPLEIDEIVRMESMCSAVEKTFIPAWKMALVVMIILTTNYGIKYFTNSPYSDEGTIWIFILSVCGVILAGFSLFGYMFWVKKSKERIDNEGCCMSSRWYRNLQNILLVGFFALAIGYLVSS